MQTHGIMAIPLVETTGTTTLEKIMMGMALVTRHITLQAGVIRIGIPL